MTRHRPSFLGLAIWAYVVAFAVYGARQTLDGHFEDGMAAVLFVAAASRFAWWLDTRVVPSED